MISYPDDVAIEGEAKRHRLSEEILVRDLARIVEVLNLTSRGFLNKRSVLAGSMALRTAGSPRFTVYDADFSIGSTVSPGPEVIREALHYEDDELEIRPEGQEPFDKGRTGWHFEPVTYEPIFTSLVTQDQFKADVSLRGLVEDGVEAPLMVPYDLGLWSEPPLVWVMSLHEVVAEKVLGWCVQGLAKHYADLGYITGASVAGHLQLHSRRLRDVLDAKLAVMTELQPTRYASFPSIDEVVRKLDAPPKIAPRQWNELEYPQSLRGNYKPRTVQTLIHGRLVPLLDGRLEKSP